MSKFVLFAVIGLLVITQILARSADRSASCGRHGDPCSVGCCNGYRCNAAAGRCMATITEDMLKDARSKLKHVEPGSMSRGSSGRSTSNSDTCGKHGDSCSKGCCSEFPCNKAAGKCMAAITGEMLAEARSKLKPVNRGGAENERRYNSQRKGYDSNLSVNSHVAVGA